MVVLIPNPRADPDFLAIPMQALIATVETLAQTDGGEGNACDWWHGFERMAADEPGTNAVPHKLIACRRTAGAVSDVATAAAQPLAGVPGGQQRVDDPTRARWPAIHWRDVDAAMDGAEPASPPAQSPPGTNLTPGLPERMVLTSVRPASMKDDAMTESIATLYHIVVLTGTESDEAAYAVAPYQTVTAAQRALAAAASTPHVELQGKLRERTAKIRQDLAATAAPSVCTAPEQHVSGNDALRARWLGAQRSGSIMTLSPWSDGTRMTAREHAAAALERATATERKAAAANSHVAVAAQQVERAAQVRRAAAESARAARLARTLARPATYVLA
eukprot:SAG11_NODE_539_length_8658_cov_8.164973_3_plen_333_part_00